MIGKIFLVETLSDDSVFRFDKTNNKLLLGYDNNPEYFPCEVVVTTQDISNLSIHDFCITKQPHGVYFVDSIKEIVELNSFEMHEIILCHSGPYKSNDIYKMMMSSYKSDLIYKDDGKFVEFLNDFIFQFNNGEFIESVNFEIDDTIVPIIDNPGMKEKK